MTDDALDSWMQREVVTAHHVSSTCKMGPASDPLAVVDQYGKVHGVEGLRICDASIMPDTVRANLNHTVIAIAERGGRLHQSKLTTCQGPACRQVQELEFSTSATAAFRRDERREQRNARVWNERDRGERITPLPPLPQYWVVLVPLTPRAKHGGGLPSRDPSGLHLRLRNRRHRRRCPTRRALPANPLA